MSIAGLDLSLTSTGIATVDGTCTVGARHVTHPGDQLIARCLHVRQQIADVTCAHGWPDLVVIEDLVVRSQAAATLGVLHGVVRNWLWTAGVTIQLVPPATLKKFATGRGNANKDAVRDAARDRGGLPAGVTSDECDAWWLREIGLHLTGDPDAVEVPKTHLAALDKLRTDG